MSRPCAPRALKGCTSVNERCSVLEGHKNKDLFANFREFFPKSNGKVPVVNLREAFIVRGIGSYGLQTEHLGKECCHPAVHQALLVVLTGYQTWHGGGWRSPVMASRKDAIHPRSPTHHLDRQSTDMDQRCPPTRHHQCCSTHPATISCIRIGFLRLVTMAAGPKHLHKPVILLRQTRSSRRATLQGSCHRAVGVWLQCSASPQGLII